MSVRPLDITAQEVEGATLPTKPRSHWRRDFEGTLISSISTVPILLWVVLVLYYTAHTVRVPYCEPLLTNESFLGAIIAAFFIYLMFVVQMNYTVRLGNVYATIGILVAMFVGACVILGFPYLGGQTTFGLFHSSPSSSTNLIVQHSEYWKGNIRACVCQTEGCEEMVYRGYFRDLYGSNVVQSLAFLNYKKLDENVIRLRPPAQDLNGTSLNNGDISSPSSDSRYHEVCFSKSSGNKGRKTVCYDCYACEEKYIRDRQRSLFKYGNKLFVLSLLLVVTNMLLFATESWARYMGTSRII